MIIRRTFEEVKYNPTKSGKCPVCGKPCTRTQKFFQTINPYNRTADGFIKSREDIYKELAIQIKEWQRIPPIHQKCKATP